MVGFLMIYRLTSVRSTKITEKHYFANFANKMGNNTVNEPTKFERQDTIR